MEKRAFLYACHVLSMISLCKLYYKSILFNLKEGEMMKIS